MKKIISALLIYSLLTIISCTTNETITEDKYSGFLNDYSNLRPDPLDVDTLAYTNPEVNWKKYSNAIIDKVTIITPEGQEKNDGALLLAVTDAARTSGLSKENVRVITEIKVTDSVSGQVLAKAIDLKAGKEMQNKESEVVLSDVEPVLEQWAQRLFNVLSGLKHQE